MRRASILLLLTGCAEDLGECEALALSECDIGEADCQEHYSALIRCVRGDDQVTPPLEVLTPKQYAERYAAEPAPPDEGDTLLVDRGLYLLGLRVPALEPFGSGAPPAFYDSDRRTVIVIDRADTRAQLRAISRAHADAALDGFLDTVYSAVETTDAALALLAAFIGESTFYGDAAWYKTRGMADAAFTEHLRANLYYEDEAANAAYGARSLDFDWIQVNGAFVFGYGAEATRRVWLAEGQEGVRAAYDPQLTSTAQVVRGDFAVLPTPGLLAEAWPPLPAGLRYVVQDALGPWPLHISQIRGLPPLEDAPIADDLAQVRSIAEAWRGDRFAVVHEPTSDDVAVVWQVELDPDSVWRPQHPMALPGEWALEQTATRATFVVASGVELRDVLTAAFPG